MSEEKKVKEVNEVDENKIPIQVGNTEVLKVKLMSDIVAQLKRIADALEKK